MEERKILNLMAAGVARLHSVPDFLVKHSMRETSSPVGLLTPTKQVSDF
jgi:hypothetical protein